MLECDIKKNMGSFNLEVAFKAEDEILGFLGASGCGKSLTLRSIAGIEKPDEGKIVVNGKVFFDKVAGKKARVDLSPQERKTALLFQNYMLFPNLTVEQNIAAGMPRGLAEDVRAKLVNDQVVRFGLVGMEKRWPIQLSGGQQQRVALARMLAADPGILMLDEPFSALDSHLKSSLEQNLIGLFKEYEGTILYVSHDIDEAFRFCDRIAVVDAGHIVQMGPKEDIVQRPTSLAAVKLSGCKNVTPAKPIDEHTFSLPNWGITLISEDELPEGLNWFGIRAFYLKTVTEMGPNVFRMRVDRVSDSRFERSVMLSFTHGEETDLQRREDDVAMRFLKSHVQWKIDKLSVPEEQWVDEGDELLIQFPQKAMYLISEH